MEGNAFLEILQLKNARGKGSSGIPSLGENSNEENFSAGLEKIEGSDEEMQRTSEWDMQNKSFFWQSQKIDLKQAHLRESQIISRPRVHRFMDEINIKRDHREFR
jgi:hypothetical protein